MVIVQYMRTILARVSAYKDSLDKSMQQNADSVSSFYDTCDAIVSSLQRELDKKELSFEEKRYIVEQMIIVAEMKGRKDTENKKVIMTMAMLGSLTVGVVTTALMTMLGGHSKIGIDKIYSCNYVDN